MFKFKVTSKGSTIRKLQDMLKDLPKEAEAVMSAASNAALDYAHREISSGISSLYTMPLPEALDTITLRRATPNNPTASLESRGSVPGMQHFEHSATSAGVKVTVRKDRGGGTIPGAFTSPDITGIFHRRGPRVVMERGRHKGKKRQRLHRYSGPAVPSMVKTVIDENELMDKAGDVMSREIDRGIDRILKK